jgi:predicted nucleic acid-binding Zn ribbon protein
VPIYEYRRPDGTTFELVQSFSDETLTVDPETGVPVERVLHAPAVHFKGKGFYNTDYGTRNRQRETAAASEGSSPKDAASGSSSESSASKSSKEAASASAPGGESSGSASEKGGAGKSAKSERSKGSKAARGR